MCIKETTYTTISVMGGGRVESTPPGPYGIEKLPTWRGFKLVIVIYDRIG